MAPLEGAEVVVPFWNIRAARLARLLRRADAPAHNLEHFAVELSVTTTVATKDSAIKGLSKPASLRVRVPYLSNPECIERGSVLTCGADAKKRKGAPE